MRNLVAIMAVAAASVLLVCPSTVEAARYRGETETLRTASAAQMPSQRVGAETSKLAARRSMSKLYERLMAQQVELGTRSPIIVQPSREQLESLAHPAEERRLRVGVVTKVGIEIGIESRVGDTITQKASPRRIGAIRRDGDLMVWTSAVLAPGANGIRLRITGLDLPPGVELAIYNGRGEAFSYTGRGPLGSGELWTNTVTGDTAYLQLTGADIGAIGLEIADLGYLGEGFVLGAGSGLDKAFCSYNESCVENAGCGIDPIATDATDAAGHMQFVSGPYLYVCSGGLLNNDAARPFFLTANHCISKGREASSLEVYFFYEIGCNDPCPQQWSTPTTPRTVGSSIVATNRTSDYTLLELSQPAPAGTVLLGWDATEIAFTDGVDLFRISHPAAAPQAYSTHTVDTSYGVCRSWPRGDWIYSRDTYGATEGGSSGSPVINGSGQVVGQLSGGCGTNINDVCDSVRNATVDGAFAAYYAEVAGFLGGGTGCDPVETCGDGIDNDCNGLIDDGCDPGGCTDADADGWCIEDGDCDDSNPDVYPGHADTKGRWGRDGVDNDCNGIIDG